MTKLTSKERPFENPVYLSGSDLHTLRAWLAENVAPTLSLTPTYDVKALLHDLDTIADGIWSDGRDSMEEDA